MDVYGRGKQRGMKVGEVTYDELPKEMIFTVVKESDKDFVVKIDHAGGPHRPRAPSATARSSSPPVDEVYTVSSGREGRARKPWRRRVPHRPSTQPYRSEGTVAMKEVLAVIRMNKMNETKQALAEAGIASFTARKVMGRGKGKVDYLLLKGAEEGHEEAISQFGPGPEADPQADAHRRRARQDWCPGGQARSST